MFLISLFSFQSMAQFKWHDGSVKNVHVDPTILFDYQVCSYSLYSSASLIIFCALFGSGVIMHDNWSECSVHVFGAVCGGVEGRGAEKLKFHKVAHAFFVPFLLQSILQCYGILFVVLLVPASGRAVV